MKRLGIVVAVTAVLGLAASLAWAHKPTTTAFTYHADIRPIFEAKCGGCHRPGGVAPMSLLSYEQAYPWAVSIKNHVLDLTMPPWFADERLGPFVAEAALTAKEIDTLVDWCLGGSPEGEPKADEEPRNGDGAAPLGSPDLELTVASPFELDADTMEATKTWTLSAGLDRDRIVRAVDFHPASPNIVRSAILSFGDGDAPHVAWIAGQGTEILPGGRGFRLPAGAAITLTIHYEKTWLDDGTPVADQSRVGLYFYDEDAATELVETRAVSVESPLEVAADTELVAIWPRPVEGAASIAAELVLADGTRTPLLRLRAPDPDWPRKYRFAEPRPLPGGSRIEVVASGAGGSSPELFLDIVSR